MYFRFREWANLDKNSVLCIPLVYATQWLAHAATSQNKQGASMFDLSVHGRLCNVLRMRDVGLGCSEPGHQGSPPPHSGGRGSKEISFLLMSTEYYNITQSRLEYLVDL